MRDECQGINKWKFGKTRENACSTCAGMKKVWRRSIKNSRSITVQNQRRRGVRY
jgi:hypothetical protein